MSVNAAAAQAPLHYARPADGMSVAATRRGWRGLMATVPRGAGDVRFDRAAAPQAALAGGLLGPP